MRTRKRLMKAVALAALVLLATGGIVWKVQQVKASNPPEPDRLNFGMIGITQGQSVRLNVVNVLPPSDLPPGPIRAQMTFVDDEGHQFINPRTGNPIQREVMLPPGRAAFLLLNFEDVSIGDGGSPLRIALRPVIILQRQTRDGGKSSPDIIIPTAEVIDNANGRTSFVLSALPAVQRQSAPTGSN